MTVAAQVDRQTVELQLLTDVRISFRKDIDHRLL